MLEDVRAHPEYGEHWGQARQGKHEYPARGELAPQLRSGLRTDLGQAGSGSKNARTACTTRSCAVRKKLLCRPGMSSIRTFANSARRRSMERIRNGAMWCSSQAIAASRSLRSGVRTSSTDSAYSASAGARTSE